MKRLLAVIMLTLLMAGLYRTVIQPATGEETVSLLVPLYSYPGCQWNELISIKGAYPVNIIVIVNPNSGPGTERDETYAQYIQNLRNSGISVLGYVWTDYGNRNISEVENDIDEWLSWYNVSGIFFDGVSTAQDDESYYSEVVQYLKDKSSSYFAVGNPGAYDDSTFSDYAGIFDVLVIYDSPGYPASWPSDVDPSGVGALVYGVPEFDESNFSTLTTRAHYVYVTDDGDPNPWDVLASYLVREAASISGSAVEDYVLEVSSQDSSSHTVVQRFLDYNLSGGVFNVTYSATVRNYDPNSGYIQPMYVDVNESGGSRVNVMFLMNGGSLEACYGWGDCVDVGGPEYDLTTDWHRLGIFVNTSGVVFYIDNTPVRTVTGKSISKVLEVGAGSWDDTSVYELYIDNVTEIRGGDVFKENFDDNWDCYFGTGADNEVTASSVPFFGSAIAVLLGISLLILTMGRR